MIKRSVKFLSIHVFLVLLTLLTGVAYAQENKISLAHHSNVECTASVNGISTHGLIASSSGTAKASGGRCHITPEATVEIILTAPTAPTSIVIEGLAADSVATYYDTNGYVVGTYTAGSGYASESVGLNVIRINITSMETLLVKNGSFESLQPMDGANVVVNANNPDTIPFWEFVSGNLDWFGTGVQAADGLRSVDLSGSQPGAIRQVIATEPGTSYTLRFALSGDPAGGLPEKQLTVSIGDVTETFTYVLSAENSTENMLWQYQSIDFTATEAETVLVFTSLVENWYGPTVDNVSVREGQTCSPATEEGFDVTFVNNMTENVSFHWMAFDCLEGEGFSLAPGETYDGSTYTGHIFRIRGADGRIIGQYVGSPENTTANAGQ